MSERYWITGVQLGIIKAVLETNNQPTGMIDEIIDKQFIGNMPEPYKKHRIVIIEKRTARSP